MTSEPKNLRDLVNDAISRGLRGRQVDALVCAHGVNVLDPAKPMPFLSINVSPAAFEYLQDGKTGIVGFNWVPRFVSIYPPRSGGFPLARVYQFPLPDMLEFARIGSSFAERGFGLKPIFPDEFEVAIEAKGHEERTTAYREDFWGRAKEFSGLLHGRLEATCVEQGIILGSKGCMRCGRDAALVMTTLSGVDGGKGLMIGFYLCQEHTKEANADANYFRYISRILGAPIHMVTGDVSFEFLVDAAAEFLKTQLDCRIEKVSDRTVRKGKPGRSRRKEMTERIVTAVRPSGFKVIVKLQDDGEYAYMVQNAAGVELARVDSAAHHDVPFGPDHLHRSPTEDNKNVVPSFTYGLPQMDAKIIRRILDQHDG